jgi:hypothetical protein
MAAFGFPGKKQILHLFSLHFGGEKSASRKISGEKVGNFEKAKTPTN